MSRRQGQVRCARGCVELWGGLNNFKQRMKKARRRILIDICHPAEVHHFKYVYRELSAKGWTILFAARRKDVAEALLLAYDLPHVMFSESKKGLLKKALHVPVELWRFAGIVRRFRPTFIFSNLCYQISRWRNSLQCSDGCAPLCMTPSRALRAFDFKTK